MISINKINAHPRDERISFESEGHKYYIDNKLSKYLSVSSVYKQYFNEIPLTKYLENLKNGIKFKTGIHELSNCTDEEILQKWKNNSTKASQHGSLLHSLIEKYYNYYPILQEPTKEDLEKYDLTNEWLSFKSFESSIVLPRQWIPYRTEWCIFDEELKITGSIDMIYKSTTTNDYFIIDWKCSKNLEVSFSGQELSIEPHLANAGITGTDYGKYSCQINIYRYLLEKNYDIKIKDVYLVKIYNNEYDMYDVINLQKEFTQIFKVE